MAWDGRSERIKIRQQRRSRTPNTTKSNPDTEAKGSRKERTIGVESVPPRFGARVDGIGGEVGWATDLEGSIAGDKEVLGGEVIAAVAVAVYIGAPCRRLLAFDATACAAVARVVSLNPKRLRAPSDLLMT